MKNSILMKLFLAILLFVIIIVSVSWIINVNFLEKYYTFKKTDTLINYSKDIEAIHKKGSYNQLEKIENIINGDISIYRIEGNYITSLYSNSGYGNGKGGKGGLPLSERDLIDVLNGEVIKSVYKHPRFNTDFLYVSKLLDDEVILVIMTPIATITESVKIVKEFYIYIGILSLIIGIILALILSKIFTKPILKLNSIAKKMSNLDFSNKYEVQSNDELGELGKSINKLSYKLDDTINELNKANEKLKEDIERKQKIDNMRKEFISSVSHELKTPISLIKGYTEGLKDNVMKNEKDRDYYYNVIIDESDKMDKLVKELLELSKIESGQISLNKEKFNITNLLKEIINKYNKVIVEKEININFIYEKEYYVFGDISKIEIVINNFINNAIDHIDYEKEIKIFIEEFNDKLKIYVRNSGKNIPNDEVDKIWDSFYKIDKSRNRKYGGTGLGLSIVKGILQLHKASFGVINEEKSVVFWFEIDK